MFECKQFSFYQSDRVHKFGTDSLLLTIQLYKNKQQANQILDIGTGTGFLSLVLAHLYPNAQINAIDIDNEAIALAAENVNLNQLLHQIFVFKSNINELNDHKKFDLIVSNPPFYHEDTKAPSKWRAEARHAYSLPLDVLFNKSSQLITDYGEIVLIYPFRYLTQLLMHAASVDLFLKKRIDIFAKKGCQAKRVVLFFSKRRFDKMQESYFILNENGLPNQQFEQDRLIWMIR